MDQLTTFTTVDSSSIRNEDIQHLSETCKQNQLVWLDSPSEYNSVPIETLREITDDTKLFEEIEVCEKYINSSHEIATFVITSDEMSQEILPHVHDLNQVLAIYIRVTSSEPNNRSFLSKYPKVKLTTRNMNLLLLKLDEDISTLLKHERNALGNNSFSSLLQKQLTSGDGWSWWSFFLDLLLCHLPYPHKECLQKLSNAMKDFYKDNPTELRNIDDFENHYRPEDAVMWYTRELFVYRLLNRAYRLRSISILFLFGFFVRDMYRQLKNEHQKFKNKHLSSGEITVYRGQSMYCKEILHIQNGRYPIVNWCFFSTTRNRSLACFYLNNLVQSEDRVQNVLFEIKINCKKMSYPYADISHLSHFSNESEILFMTGTAFHVIEIQYDQNQKAWLMKLELEEDTRKATYVDSLTNINSHSSKRPFLKKTVRTLLQRLDTIPTIVINIIFDEIFELFPTEKNWLMAVKFHCLANHQESERTDIPGIFTLRINNYFEALKIWRAYVNDTELNCHLDIADICREIAECYVHPLIKKYDEAKRFYAEALDFYKGAQESNSIDNDEKTYVYEYMDYIYWMEMETLRKENSGQILEMALENSKNYVEHLLKFCHPNDIVLARPLEKLATLYVSVERYDEALIHFKKSLDIHRSQTSPDHYRILSLAEEIADIYIKHKNDYSSALKYQEIVRDIESKEKINNRHFTTAANLHKEITKLNTDC